MTLNMQILIGSLIGVAGGFICSAIGIEHPVVAKIIYGCDIIGDTFISMLKMILIPLVFVSITVGIANLRAHAQMQRVWKIALIYYMTTTMLAVLLFCSV